MSSVPTSRRLARLQRECEVSIVPALLLLAACGAVILVVVLSALRADPAPTQAVEPATHLSAPSA